MQVKLEQLRAHLQKNLLPVYLISGDVPLLVRDAKDAISNAANQAGHDQRHTLTVGTGFDWSQFRQLTQNLGLFGDKQLIVIHNNSAKFDANGVDAILEYCQQPAADTVLIIVTSKLSAAQQRTKWFKAVAECGATTAIWPVTAAQLPRWIQQRMQQMKIRADQASIQMLAEMTEGNLLATQQALEKLRLLFPDQNISTEQMAAAISDSSKFNVFDLMNYALQGNAARCVNVIQHLRHEGSEATLVLWGLCREIRHLLTLQQQIARGANPSQLLAREWASRKSLIQHALSRHNIAALQHMLCFAKKIDEAIKGYSAANAWDQLMQLSLMLCQRGTVHVTS